MALPTDAIRTTSTPPAAGRAFYAAAMLAAPVLLLASTIAFLTAGGGINDGITGGVVSVWAVLAFVIAFVGCARVLEARAPRAASLVVFGAAAVGVGGAGFGQHSILAQILREDHGLDVVAIVDAHPFALLSLLPWGWFMPLTCVLVGALMWRTRLAPWWHGTLFILGGVLFVSGRPAQIGPIAIATDVVLIVAFWLLAARTLDRRAAALSEQ